MTAPLGTCSPQNRQMSKVGAGWSTSDWLAVAPHKGGLYGRMVNPDWLAPHKGGLYGLTNGQLGK